MKKQRIIVLGIGRSPKSPLYRKGVWGIGNKAKVSSAKNYEQNRCKTIASTEL